MDGVRDAGATEGLKERKTRARSLENKCVLKGPGQAGPGPWHRTVGRSVGREVQFT